MHPQIELNPRVCGGKPVIRGTRIPVSVILELLAAGETWDDLLREYPELERNDIRACLEYAKESIEHSDVVVTTGS